MKVEAFIIAWNEADTINLTIKHYQQFCDKITIYDNYSDDGTDKIALELGCEVKTFGTKGVLSDRDYVLLKNNCWKGSDADWVIVCDCDEIIYHPRIYDVLVDNIDKVTVFKTYGWQVFSNDMPKAFWQEITTGFHDKNYSKFAVFSPKRITEIGYVYGCHEAKMRGDIRLSDDILTLFHYRNVGGALRLINRHQKYRERLSEHNKKWGLGSHYLYEDDRRLREWKEQNEKSVTYSADGITWP